MNKDAILKALKNKTVCLNSIIGVLIFFIVGIHFMVQNKEWKEIELNEHNAYLSIKIPPNSQNIYYSTMTRSGKPMIVSVFKNADFVIQDLQNQLVSQGWNFKKEKLGSDIKGNMDGTKEFYYEKGKYRYTLTSINNGQWRETLTTD